jgi:hypothetical protein
MNKLFNDTVVDYQQVIVCGVVIERPVWISVSEWIDYWDEFLGVTLQTKVEAFDEAFHQGKEEGTDKGKEEGYTEAIYDAMEVVEGFFDKDEHKIKFSLTSLMRSLIKVKSKD